MGPKKKKSDTGSEGDEEIAKDNHPHERRGLATDDWMFYGS